MELTRRHYQELMNEWTRAVESSLDTAQRLLRMLELRHVIDFVSMKDRYQTVLFVDSARLTLNATCWMTGEWTADGELLNQIPPMLLDANRAWAHLGAIISNLLMPL
jgi:hypothetical protein